MWLSLLVGASSLVHAFEIGTLLCKPAPAGEPVAVADAFGAVQFDYFMQCEIPDDFSGNVVSASLVLAYAAGAKDVQTPPMEVGLQVSTLAIEGEKVVTTRTFAKESLLWEPMPASAGQMTYYVRDVKELADILKADYGITPAAGVKRVSGLDAAGLKGFATGVAAEVEAVVLGASKTAVHARMASFLLTLRDAKGPAGRRMSRAAGTVAASIVYVREPKATAFAPRLSVLADAPQLTLSLTSGFDFMVDLTTEEIPDCKTPRKLVMFDDEVDAFGMPLLSEGAVITIRKICAAECCPPLEFSSPLPVLLDGVATDRPTFYGSQMRMQVIKRYKGKPEMYCEDFRFSLSGPTKF